MRVIALRTLREFWQNHPDAEQPLRTWYAKTKRAIWTTPSDVKTAQRNVSIIANNRAIFNIKGNDYRLVVALDYEYGVVYIRFVGTHRAYDQIDATTI
jgi:mRNA interferase HigB